VLQTLGYPQRLADGWDEAWTKRKSDHVRDFSGGEPTSSHSKPTNDKDRYQADLEGLQNTPRRFRYHHQTDKLCKSYSINDKPRIRSLAHGEMHRLHSSVIRTFDLLLAEAQCKVSRLQLGYETKN
jgi:hypothetical protein